MTTDPTDNIRVIDLNGESITLDPKRFVFNDASLGKFMEDVSLWYDYYSSKTTKSEGLLVDIETLYENKYLEKFLAGKQEGFSDKAAEAYAKTDVIVKECQEQVNKYKSATKQLKEYLKSFDKAHSMAMNRGFMIRKEMEKLNSDINLKNDSCNIDDIIGKIKKDKEE
jgi:predicted metallo-beta-lactamase superfamily hydrolase